jgi:hypothetical protein
MNGKLELVESFHYPLAHNLIMSNGAGNLRIKKSKLPRHPTCPECGKKLVHAGVIEGVGNAPSNVFQCLENAHPFLGVITSGMVKNLSH